LQRNNSLGDEIAIMPENMAKLAEGGSVRSEKVGFSRANSSPNM
jgi:hypothetical protein